MADTKANPSSVKTNDIAKQSDMVKTQTIKPPVQGGGDEMDIEMDASNQPAFSMMRPAFGESFPLPIVKSIMNNIMTEKLKDKTYDKNIAKTWTREIADEVNQQIATNSKVKRYKHVVQVMLGQELGAGATYLSRCCWDCDCDTSISEVFSNTSLFCVCTVYATFQY